MGDENRLRKYKNKGKDVEVISKKIESRVLQNVFQLFFFF